MAKARAKSRVADAASGCCAAASSRFPPAFIHAGERARQEVRGVTAEMVTLGGTKMGEPPPLPRHRRSHLARGRVLPRVR